MGTDGTQNELTWKAVLLGALLSAVLAGANAYLGLKVGMTVSASIPAAVLSLGLLRFFRNTGVLEHNLVQTAASAGETLAAGVIFTLPALLLIGHWEKFELLPTLSIALIGGVLGVLFTIPLRRALVVEAKLSFPEGVATSEVLRAGNQAGGIRALAIAGLLGGLLKFAQTGLRIAGSRVQGAFAIGPSTFGMGVDLSAALLAVGHIVGVQIALVVFAGGFIAWGIAIPIYMAVAPPEFLSALVEHAHGYEAAEAVWSGRIRYLGVGAMSVGGLWSIFSLLGPLKEGIRSSLRAARAHKEKGFHALPREERDIPFGYVITGTLVLAVPLFAVLWFVLEPLRGLLPGGSYLIATIGLSLLALFGGFVFSAVGGYMSGIVGSSNNPTSGITIATLLVTSLALLLFLESQGGWDGLFEDAVIAAAAAILVGGVVCCAASLAGDNLQDLKAGHILGATPYKQQIMQLVGVVVAALVLTPVLQLLLSAYGIGDIPGKSGLEDALQAPQARIMSAVATGVFTASLPWNLVAIGGGIALATIALDKALAGRGIRVPVLALAIGIYLPIELSACIGLGGILSYVGKRAYAGKRAHAESRASSDGTGKGQALLVASGLIAGESLVGILLAIPFALAGSTAVFRVPVLGEPSLAWAQQALGLLFFGALAGYLYASSNIRRK